jgi:hypothetical protein
VKLPELLVCVLVGVLLCFAVPRPPELAADAWHLFGVFVATIAGG